MTDDSAGNTASPLPPKGLGQLKLFGICAIALAPVILATAMYFGGYGVPESYTNHGTLVLPPLEASSEPALASVWKRPEMTQEDGKPKWLLAVIDAVPGATDGETIVSARLPSLYIARQVAVATGKDQERISYGWLRESFKPVVDSKEAGTLLVDYASLERIEIDQKAARALNDWLSQSGIRAAGGDLVLADPNGNFIMYYPAETAGGDILDDLKRLLKVSKIG